MPDQKRERLFGEVVSAAFVVGTVVGTGIYLKPGTVAALLEAGWQVLLLWALAGLFATCGAVVYSHLARNWPYNGGPYYYLKSVYGAWAGSLLMAADIFLARPAAVGALATGLGLVWSLSHTEGLVLAISVVWVLTIVQLAGGRVQGMSQVLLTGLQLIPLLAIVTAWGLSSSRQVEQMAPSPEVKWAGAFLAILWAYDGWYNITILAGEVSRPNTTLRRSLVGGMIGVTLLYVGLNYVLLEGLGREAMSRHPVAYLLLFEKWDVPWLGVALQASLSVALLATLNGTLACGARMIVAGAEDGIVHPRVGPEPTGWGPTLAFSGWCVGLVLLFGGLPLRTNLFDSLSEFTAVVVTLLSGLTITCLFHRSRFRHQIPLSAFACALFYLLVALLLLFLMVTEQNLLALWGVLTVGAVGTILWMGRRRTVSLDSR